MAISKVKSENQKVKACRVFFVFHKGCLNFKNELTIQGI
jgi:hypothetical protein